MAVRLALRFAGKLPKAGNSSPECEDDFCVSDSSFAVADGASDGAYSQIWAGILVRSFCATGNVADWNAAALSSWIEESRLQWSDWERGLAERELPWFTREKLLHGSYATFLGVSIAGDKWRALAWGDSCLFVVRDDTLSEAFPIRHSQIFDNTPALLPSRAPIEMDRLKICEGHVVSGDRLYITTDALANWFLSDCERGEKPWAVLEGIRSDDHLEIFVSEQRQNQTLKNDDVTLLSLEFVD